MNTFALDLESLKKDKIQLHQAIKLLALVASVLRETQPDFSHSALKWQDGIGFTTQPIVGSVATQSFRVTLDPTSLNLSILNNRGKVLSSFSLSDFNLSNAYDWLRIVLNQHLQEFGLSPKSIASIAYKPKEPNELGFKFDISSMTSNLTDYYASAAKILENISQSKFLASPVQIWAHHFDIAVLISFPDENGIINAEEGKSIGVGLSPGDGGYDEPYWYVTPYPYPEDKTDLPDLESNGFWHTEGWVGAVLTASRFGDPKDSIDAIEAFINSAIAGCKRLLQTIT